MPRIVALALVLSCAFLLPSCGSESSHDQEISDKIKEFDAIRTNTSIGKDERDKQMQQLAKKLTRAYPGALPIGKDSTEKIIKIKLPDTIGIFQRTDRYTFYQKPADKPPFDSAITYPKKEYFAGMATYGIRKGKRLVPQQGIIVTVRDQGYLAEWFGAVMLDQVLKGNGQAGFESMMRGHKFVQIIEHFGQKWAVWYEPGRSRPYHPATRVFVTHWNRRFSVFAVSTDTTQHTPEYVGKVIDVEWLSQLKYPSK